MEICEESGFFHEDFSKFRSDISDSDIRAFSQLENDEQRVRFVHQIVEDRYGGKLWNPVREIGIGKSLSKALEAKERGNSAFQYEKWQESLRCYNDACLLLPSENGECYEWLTRGVTLDVVQTTIFGTDRVFVACANLCIPKFVGGFR